MEISIIIVNYKSKGLVRQNLFAIEHFTSGEVKEVIVVDNNSRDGSEDMIRERFYNPRIPIKFIQTGLNHGFAAGVNRGIQKAEGDFLLISNPDIVIEETAINTLKEFMDQNPRAGLIGPKLVQPDGTRQYSAFAFPSFWTPMFRRTVFKNLPAGKQVLRVFLLKDKDTAHNCKVDWLQGSCLLARREALNKVGLMDEQFFMYFEDTDWCRRFQEAGWEVWYVPQAVMTHYFNRWSAEYGGIIALFSRATWIHIRSWLYYFYKWNWKIPKHENTRQQ